MPTQAGPSVTSREIARCENCGKCRPFEGDVCPLCGSISWELEDEAEVGESEWVL